MTETITITMTQLQEILRAVGVTVAGEPAGYGPGLEDQAVAYVAEAANKDRRIAARIDDALYERARRTTGIDKDSELVRAGLEALADPDDFGTWLASQRGTLSRDFRIDL